MSKARDIWSLESHVVRTRLNGLQLYANALNAEKKIYSETLVCSFEYIDKVLNNKDN